MNQEKLAALFSKIDINDKNYDIVLDYKAASNRFTRFLSSLKGPFFGNDPGARERRYRLSFLYTFTELKDNLLKLEEEITKTSPTSIITSTKIVSDINRNFNMLNKAYNYYLDSVKEENEFEEEPLQKQDKQVTEKPVEKATKVPVEKSVDTTVSKPVEKAEPKVKKEAPQKIIEDQVDGAIDVYEAYNHAFRTLELMSRVLNYVNGNDDIKDKDQINAALNDKFKIDRSVISRFDLAHKEGWLNLNLEDYKYLLLKLVEVVIECKKVLFNESVNETYIENNISYSIGQLMEELAGNQEEKIANRKIELLKIGTAPGRWLKRFQHVVMFWNHTSPMRIDIADLAKEARKYCNEIMNNLEGELDLESLKVEMDNLNSYMVNLSRLIKILKEDFRKVKGHEYFTELNSKK